MRLMDISDTTMCLRAYNSHMVAHVEVHEWEENIQEIAHSTSYWKDLDNTLKIGETRNYVFHSQAP
jgi:hypothetical protein